MNGTRITMSMNQAPVAAVNTEIVGNAPFRSFDHVSESAMQSQSARESRQVDVQSSDVLVQLRSNLSQLEELHARLRFVMAEVSYLLKR